MTATRRYDYRLGSRSGPVLRLFGVRGPEDAFVDVSDSELIARFGRFEARTPITNISSWRIEGPWLWITAMGVRMSVRHGDLTFGGSPHGGVRLDFHTPITVGRLRPRALYLTVDDLDGLAADLVARGIGGEDARTT